MMSGRTLLVALAAGMLAATGDGAEEAPSRFHPFAWMANETESAHVSIGRLKGAYPVWNVDTGLGIEDDAFGYALVAVWTESDLSSHYHLKHRRLFHEIDPVVSYGYRWLPAEGWTLDSRVGVQWNVMDGYYGDSRRSYDEWQWREELAMPWITVWWQMRNFYWPVPKASWRFGARKTIPLYGGLSLVPCLWFDGGCARWNQQRFGYHDPGRIGRGLNTATLQLFLNYELSGGWVLYGGLSQYSAVDSDVRSELQRNPTREGKADLLFATLGLRWDFR